MPADIGFDDDEDENFSQRLELKSKVALDVLILGAPGRERKDEEATNSGKVAAIETLETACISLFLEDKITDYSKS